MIACIVLGGRSNRVQQMSAARKAEGRTGAVPCLVPPHAREKCACALACRSHQQRFSHGPACVKTKETAKKKPKGPCFTHPITSFPVTRLRKKIVHTGNSPNPPHSSAQPGPHVSLEIYCSFGEFGMQRRQHLRASGGSSLPSDRGFVTVVCPGCDARTRHSALRYQYSVCLRCDVS